MLSIRGSNTDAGMNRHLRVVYGTNRIPSAETNEILTVSENIRLQNAWLLTAATRVSRREKSLDSTILHV